MASDGGPSSTLLKADEVDVSGSYVARPPSDTKPTHALSDTPGLDVVQVQNSDSIAAKPTSTTAAPSKRPALTRERSLPPPQQPPPPAPPQDDSDTPLDSISLGQLKSLVTEFPREEPTPYAFVYKDTSSLEEEIEEFFGYGEEERAKLVRTKEAFEVLWGGFLETDEAGEHGGISIAWYSANDETRGRFLARLGDMLDGNHVASRLNSLVALAYVALGCWNESLEPGDEAGEFDAEKNEDTTLYESDEQHESLEKSTTSHIQRIVANVRQISKTIGAERIFGAARPASFPALAPEVAENLSGEDQSNIENGSGRRTSWAAITVMYLLIEIAIRDSNDGDNTARSSLLSLEPSLLNVLTDWLAESRWEESAGVPSQKLLLLYWKLIILTFGGTTKADEIRRSLHDDGSDIAIPDDQPRITASPLDYHMFRQEIISKYPAFNPPEPIFPFEPENNSLLPPLQEYNDRPDEESGRIPGVGVNGSVNTASIIHQPVHIATPAPSPPPSPAGPGGKGIKKQNYQTNQMFPFLYPPLEESSNDLGGKGSTALQDLLVGRKWLGKDIPISILEAADLFAQRMKATRAMKQLWDERVRFMKYERGFRSIESTEDGSHDVEEAHPGVLNQDLQDRLQAVEDFYRRTLPQLQSLVVVLIKVLLQTVTTLATQPNASNGSPNGGHNVEQDGQPKTGTQGETSAPVTNGSDLSVQEIDRIRSQEIMNKAMSGILLLLLKWFKISHVLKFEYLTQLLLDSSYVHLTLKMFSHQELDRLVSCKSERKEFNFFQWSRIQSGRPLPKDPESLDSPVDDQPQLQTTEPPNLTDEHSNPTTTLPLTTLPLTTLPPTNLPPTSPKSFSWRALFTTITHLRTLQKIIKQKPHRQLLMVQLKYSNTLKKALKVPQNDVRLYTLKIIKGQVPYCHRKWRQGNMRVITAIYLHCRPSLRDEWLAGCDVDQEVGEALPQERALRALTYWYNLRRYPEGMGVEGRGTGEDWIEDDDGEMGGDGGKAYPLQEEPDFFLRELERMDLGPAAYADAAVFEDEADGDCGNGGEGLALAPTQGQGQGQAQGQAQRWEPPLRMEGY